ncbi:MAG: amino acid adenylation domain-containing protein, partial [Gemmatimonadetes bacterium]|nr:amino acid adenylation domain-containing protein [Gemmatimonadota bacterium]
EVRVGLCLARSPEIAVAVLGVLRAGGAYVPVDPAYPPDRIAYLLEDSGVALVLAQEGTRSTVPDAAAPVHTLEALLAAPPAGDAAPVAGAVPGNTAYVIYTSGSTGRPKGVVVTHANVVRLFRATEDRFGFGERDVWTLFHSYAFDFSVWELWGALLYGGRLVVVPYEVSRDPAGFRALLARERVTVLNQTPSAFRQLVRADEGAEGELALRWVVFGGEALEPRSLKPWFDRHGDERPRLVNMYGITETTVHVTFRPLTREDAEAGAGSMVGEGIPDLGVYLLDERMEPVPTGVAGEMYVGGAGVARGYLGRPELTAERFVPDPFAGRAGARMYRSGDRARRHAGGDTEYLGRGDQQVKVRGFRIEPGEVEAALLAQPRVREALVAAREDEPGVRRLVAYLVMAAAEGEPDVAGVRAALAARLPDYMVPAAFVLLDAFPLTAHGKVDRRALPAPDGARLAAASAYVAPRGPVEAALARVWAETLGVERVGAHDNYFALGGDSMRALQALALARARGVPFSLQDLFRHQTVAELAEHVVLAEQTEVGRVTAPFALLAPADRERVPPGVDDAYPMTQLQLGMLFHSESRPGGAVYHNVQTVPVRAAFDEARLRSAVATLAERHPVLRTSFELDGFTEPVQLVHRRVEVPLAVTSLAHLAPEARGAALDDWVESERRLAFDWRAAPLIRFHVHLLGADGFHFGFTEHHAILDGWSVATLLAELFGAYFDASAPRDAPPPASVLRDFVALEREVIASPEARAFWTEVLDGSVPTLPAALGPAAGTGNRSRRGTLPASVAAGLAGLARREGLPLKSLLLAAHLRVLAATAGSGDVVTGLVSNGRPEGAEAERALGLFLNTVPLRLRLDGGSWLDLARAAFEQERRTLPFRRFPVAELQRMRGGEPPFAALFNYVHFHVMDRVAAEHGERFGGGRGSGGTNFPFSASFEATPSDLHLGMQYDTGRYSEGEAEVLFGRYLAVLARMVEDPHGRHDASDLLADAERARLAGWGSSGALPGAPALLHEEFAAWAARTPDAVAVEHGAAHLTYAELDRRSARLARALRRRGVGPEARVGVCLERSVELVVAILGVLRAGGVYLPLDPSNPSERLAWMVADAGAAVVLTTGRLEDRLVGTRAERLRLDTDRAEVEREEGPEPWDGARPDTEGLAYVIYTSGSTGTPKGVGVSHRSAWGHLRWIDRVVLGREVEAIPATTRISFDASLKQLVGPLLRGGRVWILDEATVADPAAVLRALEGMEGVAFNCVPSLWSAVLDAVEAGAPAPRGVRRLLLGGEAFGEELARRSAAALPGVEVWNLYGPTETTVVASGGRVLPGCAPAMGRPVVGARAYVVDPWGGLAPAGAPGELWIAGEGVARGYLGRPGLTAERFAPDPFADEPGARLYRTGDRARWLPSGELEYLGRLDAQVKVRGFRIEPGEVEAALAAHPAVREAAVDAREDASGERRLVGYVVPIAGDVVPAAAELRAHLRARLPGYMVPAAFVVLEEMPRTPTGKLDRRALPAPEGRSGETEFVAPRDALELRLAGVWEELLGVHPVGVRDDFFALGGHSLLVLRLLARVERLTGRRIPMGTLLAGPTVERLAGVLREGAPLRVEGPLVPIQPAGSGRPLFFVHAAGG